MESELFVLGIDPAPAKASVLFDWKEFLYFFPKELQQYLQEKEQEKPLFISWDAPLSAALDDASFSLTIRPIERFFNRLGRHAKALGIPEGITTLGYASCPHWTLSQYIFALPKLHYDLHREGNYKLLMEDSTILQERTHYITEIHPALSLWIFFHKEFANDPLFRDSWKYKGDRNKETLLRRERLSEAVLVLAQRYFAVNKLVIASDDELDAFVCWFVAKLYLDEEREAAIYGNTQVGSFLLPFDPAIKQAFSSYIKTLKPLK